MGKDMRNSIPIANIEGLHDLSLWANINPSIGQCAVYIHNQQFEFHAMLFHTSSYS